MSEKEITSTKRTRMILAGKLMLGEGLSLKQALIKAGYSENTARTPSRHGLDAKACIEMALQEDRETEPATLREGARKLFKRRLEVALEDPKRESLTSVARAVETCERSYGRAQDPGGSKEGARSFADRLTFIANLVVVQIKPGEGPAAAVARLIGSAGENAATTVLEEVLRLQDAQGGGDTAEIGATGRLEQRSSD